MGMDITAGVTFICKLGVSEFPPILGPEAESLQTYEASFTVTNIQRFCNLQRNEGKDTLNPSKL